MLPGIVVPLIRSHARRASGSEPMSRERTPRREASEPDPAPPSEVSGKARGPEDGRERKESDRPEPEGVREEKRRRVADPSDVPVPEDIADDDLIIDDITFVDGMDPDVPDGWVMVDGEYELSDVWMVQNLRKTEASEKTMTADEKALMMQAKMEEHEDYFRNKVWNFAEVNPGDESRIVSTRWVLIWKVTENGPKAKARLVLRGYQDPDLIGLEKSAPTAGRLGKVFLMLFVQNLDWLMFVGDVRAAFLSGASFDRKILAKLPADCSALLGVRGQAYMRLLRSAYGLADAPLLWYREAKSRVEKIGFRCHRLDKCCFMYYGKADYAVILIMHVDDVQARESEADAVVEEVRKNFDFGKWKKLSEKNPITYCGCQISIQHGEINLDAEEYLKQVKPITVDKNGTGDMTDREVSKCRGLLGALQWPAGQVSPHLCATTSILASEVAARARTAITELNKGLRFAKATAGVHLKFPSMVKNLDELCFVAFSDAAFGIRRDFSSQGGYILAAANKKLLEGERMRYTTLAWRSFKLDRVCRSSLSAESQACATATGELMITKLFYSLMLDPDQDLRSGETVKKAGQSAVVIDARYTTRPSRTRSRTLWTSGLLWKSCALRRRLSSPAARSGG